MISLRDRRHSHSKLKFPFHKESKEYSLPTNLGLDVSLEGKEGQLTQRLVLDEGEDGHVPHGPPEEPNEAVKHPLVLPAAALAHLGKLYPSSPLPRAAQSLKGISGRRNVIFSGRANRPPYARMDGGGRKEWQVVLSSFDQLH